MKIIMLIFKEIEGRINWTVLSPLHIYSYMFKIPLLVFKIPAVSTFSDY